MEVIMKSILAVALLAAIAPLTASANGVNLVTAFETYCLKQTNNLLPLDKAVSEKSDRHVADKDVLLARDDDGYFMTSSGRQYLIEWGRNTCRVSTSQAMPSEVMKALATNHMLSVPHGDKTDFGRAHWFEPDHVLTRYAFTHDLGDTTILLEYQTDDATKTGPVAITLTR
jgi:hypothetical protein